MTIYFTLLILLLIGWFLSRCKGFNSNILWIACLTILIYIGAFKSLSVGTDTVNYYNFFRYIQSYKFSETFSGTQIVFYYYNLLIHNIANYNTYMFICYTIIYGGTAIYIKKCSSNSFCSLTIFYLLFYLGSLNVMRQYISMGLFCIGLTYLFKNNIKKYLLMTFIAGCFHFSALLMLPLAFLRYFKLSHNFTLLITIASFYIGFFANIMAPVISLLNIFAFLNENAAGYIRNWGAGDERNILTNAIINGAFILSYLLSKNKNSTDLQLWFLFIVFSNLFGAAGQANRIFLYLLFGSIITIPNVIKQTKDNSITHYCYISYISIYTFAYWYAMLSTGINGVVPYSFR